MKRKLKEKIKSLPPLPNSILELEEFRKLNSSDPLILIDIIKRDPLLVANILKIANSSMFGFRSSVDTLSRAISLLGVNFTVSIAFGSIVQNTIKSNLSPYKIGLADFMKLCALSSTLIEKWIGKIDFDLKEELLMPAFLQETGKFIISTLLEQEHQKDAFLEDLNKYKNICTLEEKYIGLSTPKITAYIFKHWSLSENITYPIAYVNDLENCPKKFLKKSQILDIVKTLVDIRNPLNEDAIQLALKKANSYNLDKNRLQTVIIKLQKEFQ
ncbi:MAG: HDOD domain-containing protein [Campylobacterota bacterium]